MSHVPESAAIQTLRSLVAAVNRHDVAAIASHFSDAVRSETPAHPARSFVGSAQVGRNWSQILGAVRDLHADIGSIASVGDTVLAELAFDGFRSDGSPWQMRGVTVNEVIDGRIDGVRFYLEPVDAAGSDAPAVDAAVRGIVAPTGAAR